MRDLFLCNFFSVQKLLQNCAIHNNFPGVSIKQTEPKQGKTGTQIAESIVFYCLKLYVTSYKMYHVLISIKHLLWHEPNVWDAACSQTCLRHTACSQSVWFVDRAAAEATDERTARRVLRLPSNCLGKLCTSNWRNKPWKPITPVKPCTVPWLCKVFSR